MLAGYYQKSKKDFKKRLMKGIKIFLKMENKGYLSIKKIILKCGK